MKNILVIKHGALGDVILATGAFQAIRAHHQQDRITLLTTKTYATLLKHSPYFDEIWIDEKPKLYHIFRFSALLKKIRNARFDRVYDLQTSERTSWYFRLLGAPKPEWSGAVAGASHRHNTPERTELHSLERHRQQLLIAGIDTVTAPDVQWMQADMARFQLPARYAVIIPGGSAHRPGKRWPASHYAEFCRWLLEQEITPVLIGTKAESSVLSTIESLAPQVMNLGEKTSFHDIATLARHAVIAVGNDTGPTHLVASAGCPCLVLFSEYSDPARSAPRGAKVKILREQPLASLDPRAVMIEAEKLLKP